MGNQEKAGIKKAARGKHQKKTIFPVRVILGLLAS